MAKAKTQTGVPAPENLPPDSVLPSETEAAQPIAQPDAPTTAPLKLLGSMTWEQECAYYRARRGQLLGENNSGSTGNKN